MSLARHLASQPTRGLALVKRALDASAANDLDAQLDLSATCSAWPAVPRTSGKG